MFDLTFPSSFCQPSTCPYDRRNNFVWGPKQWFFFRKSSLSIVGFDSLTETVGISTESFLRYFNFLELLILFILKHWLTLCPSLEHTKTPKVVTIIHDSLKDLFSHLTCVTLYEGLDLSIFTIRSVNFFKFFSVEFRSSLKRLRFLFSPWVSLLILCFSWTSSLRTSVVSVIVDTKVVMTPLFQFKYSRPSPIWVFDLRNILRNPIFTQRGEGGKKCPSFFFW